MKLQILKTVAITIVCALALFFINKLFLESNSFSKIFDLYTISLTYTYSVLTAFSLVILIVLIIVNSKNKDIVGMTFLLLTSIKGGLCYFIFSEIVTARNENNTERINFFMIFIFFLAIETLITIRLLNKKQ